LLKDRGLNYKIVNNGQEVIDEILSNNNYDIVFMDINMPVLDGISATKYLRKNDYKKPIISLSANVIESDIKSFKKAGVDDTLNKPIVPEELNKILHKYLNNKEKIEYDIIDIDLISKNLFLDKDMVLKLLKSFSTSVEEMLKKLESNYIDEDLAHSIKGVSGNLRLKKLYDLSTKFEKSLPNWSELEHEKNRNILISHLKEILKQIDLLNK
jgi:CheY-like chemotaxis protein/plasmid maintenance system antidote protein VapI